MKITIALLFLCSLSLHAEEKKAKDEFTKTVNTGAKNIEKETRKIIKNTKDVLSGKKDIKKND